MNKTKNKEFTQKTLVLVWVAVTLISLVLALTLGQIHSLGQGLLVAVLIVMGWSFLFLVIKMGLDQRRFKQIVIQTNGIIASYQKQNTDEQGENTVVALESLYKQALTREEKEYVHYYLAGVLFQLNRKEEARKILALLPGFPDDPRLHEEFLQLKNEAFIKENEYAG